MSPTPRTRSILAYLPPLVLAVLLTAAGLLWWRSAQAESGSKVQAQLMFPEAGIVRVTGCADVSELALWSGGEKIAWAQSHGQNQVDLRTRWSASRRYEVHADGRLLVTAQAPATVPQYAIYVHAPLGQPPTRTLHPGTQPPKARPIFLPAPAGQRGQLLIEVEKLTGHGILQVLGEPQVATQTADAIYKERLALEFDRASWTVPLPQRDAEDGSVLRLQVHVNQWSHIFDVHVGGADRDAQVKLQRWDMPTTPSGRRALNLASNELNLSNHAWQGLASWLGMRTKAVDYFRPFSHQAVTLENPGTAPLTVLIESDVVDAKSGTPVRHFQPPEIEGTGSTEGVHGYVTIEPKAEAVCVLPVYVAPETLAGSYERVLAVKAFGSDALLLSVRAPLHVNRSKPAMAVGVMTAVGLSVTWILLMVLGYRRLVNAFGLKLLVALSLLGALQFALQFAGGILSTISYALLGPFNCLVGGLITEVLTYVVIAAILCLVPRVGAMSVAAVVAYLMGAVMFGAFTLTDLVFWGSGVALRELCLFLAGVTRLKHHNELPSVFALMLALGVADAASTFASLSLQAVFYRLYFADWYVLLQLLVTGFLYTAIGAYFGHRLGRSLREVWS